MYSVYHERVDKVEHGPGLPHWVGVEDRAEEAGPGVLAWGGRRVGHLNRVSTSRGRGDTRSRIIFLSRRKMLVLERQTEQKV